MSEVLAVDTLPGSAKCQLQIQSAMALQFVFDSGEVTNALFTLEAFLVHLVSVKKHQENIFEAKVTRSPLTDPRRDFCVHIKLRGINTPFLFSRKALLEALQEAQFLYSTVRGS